jgi:hypothetical protein
MEVEGLLNSSNEQYWLFKYDNGTFLVLQNYNDNDNNKDCPLLNNSKKDIYYKIIFTISNSTISNIEDKITVKVLDDLWNDISNKCTFNKWVISNKTITNTLYIWTNDKNKIFGSHWTWKIN